MNSTLPPFPPFEHEEDQNTVTYRWRRWAKKFDNFMTGLNIKESNRKKALLRHYIGDSIDDMLDTLPNVGQTYEEAIDALNAHFSAQQNEEHEIYKFRQLFQQSEETLDQYITKLKKAAATCGFTNEQREIKSQVIMGCSSKKLRRHALLTTNIDLQELINYGRTNEITEKQALAIESIVTPGNVNFSRREPQKQQHAENKHRTPRYQHRKEKQQNCNYCGEHWHQEGLKACKARGKTCYKCNKLNHLARVCKQRHNTTGESTFNSQLKLKHDTSDRSSKAVNMISNLNLDESDNEFVYANFQNAKHYEIVTFSIGKQNLTFVVDSGATVNIINSSDYETLSPKPLIKPPKTLVYAYGAATPIDIVGTVNLNIKLKDEDHIVTFHVSNESRPSLIGKNTATKLNIIKFFHTTQKVYSNIEKQPENERETQNITRKYPNLFKGIGKMNTTKIKLHINDQIKPIIQKHRRIPFHIRKKVELELEELMHQEIIEKVPTNEPTTWISPIHVAPKKTDPTKIRICIDMRQANTAITRERHITPTMDDILCDLNGAKYFSKLDLAKGYHQLELDETCRHITTFSTHLGLYRYKRLNFGINAAAERFQHEIHKIIQTIPGTLNVSDDILIFGRTKEEHDRALHNTLSKLQKTGLTLNAKKCKFNKGTLKFLGHTFSKEGIKPDKSKIAAIQTLKPPTNISETRSFLGLINFCNKFIPQLAETTKPIRELIRKNTKWEWTQTRQKAFELIKNKLTKTTSLSYFDKTKPTELWTDASPIGLGAILVQRIARNQIHIIAYASHALNQTESNYSQIEKEALAITWAIQHFHLYLYGCAFTVVTDHKPLVFIFNNPKMEMSSRLQRWRLKLQQYEFEVIYKAGKANPSDYMSRHPEDTNTLERNKATNAAEHFVNFTINNSIPKTMTLQDIQMQTKLDPTIQEAINFLHSGKWTKSEIPGINKSRLQALKKIHIELSTNNEKSILLRGTRIVLPETLQQTAINIAHATHMGISKTKSLLKEKIWFPGMDKFIERKIKMCIPCLASNKQNTRSPLMIPEQSTTPWEIINIDHKGPLQTGEYLLVVVDQFSKFPLVEIVTSTSAKQNIAKLDAIFATFGTPNTVYTDNGSPFSGLEFKQFAKDAGFTHKKITPYWPQANSTVERFNRTINKILRIAHCTNTNWKGEMNKLLRDYRTTAHTTTQIAPAQLLFGRTIPNKIPDARQLKIMDNSTPKKVMQQKIAAKTYYDEKHKVTPNNLETGDLVLVKQIQQNKLDMPYNTTPHEVTSTKGTMITAKNTMTGKELTRNTSFFKPIINTYQTKQPMDTISKTDTNTENSDNKKKEVQHQT